MKIQFSRDEEKAIEIRLRNSNEKSFEFETSRICHADGLNYSYIIKVQRTSKIDNDALHAKSEGDKK